MKYLKQTARSVVRTPYGDAIARALQRGEIFGAAALGTIALAPMASATIVPLSTEGSLPAVISDGSAGLITGGEIISGSGKHGRIGHTAPNHGEFNPEFTCNSYIYGPHGWGCAGYSADGNPPGPGNENPTGPCRYTYEGPCTSYTSAAPEPGTAAAGLGALVLSGVVAAARKRRSQLA